MKKILAILLVLAFASCIYAARRPEASELVITRKLVVTVTNGSTSSRSSICSACASRVYQDFTTGSWA